ncbi:MAG: hypothetical protein ACI9J3_000236 [Parvicellaceae bacterium]|jgi:hypothetical protein
MKYLKTVPVILLFIAVNLSATSQVSSGLLLHYSFNGANAIDDAGSSNGTINGANLCPDRFGNPNKAFSFFNSNIFSPSITIGSLSQASMSIWLEPDAAMFTGSIATAVQIGYWASYMNRHSTNGTIISVFDASSVDNSAADETNPLPTSNWFHVVSTNDGNTTKLYVNGVLESTYPEPFVWVDGTRDLWLGVRGLGAGSPTDYYNGKIDDFRIYGKALTPAEVDSLFNMANPTVAVNEVLDVPNISLFPNPSQNSFQVVSDKSIIDLKIEILDLAGKVILKKNFVKEGKYDISSFADGTYIVKITDDITISTTKKIVKYSN